MSIKRVLDYTQSLDYIERHHALIKRLYITLDMTARKVAENQNIQYHNNFQKALLRTFGPKGKGHGGARPGSGQKKKKRD